jgi:hypothetical protein
MSSACAMLKEGCSASTNRFCWRARLVIALRACAKHELKHFLFNSLFCTHTMDTLDNTEWDVLIVGTGLQQSLLAL